MKPKQIKAEMKDTNYYFTCPKCNGSETLTMEEKPNWRVDCFCGWKGWESDCNKVYRRINETKTD